MRSVLLILPLVLVAAVASARDVRSAVPADAGSDVTRALQLEMERLSAAGGGRLIVGPGHYEVSDLALQSRVELHLERGARLVGTGDGGVYPSGETYPLNRPEKRGHAVVRADGAVDAALTGEGTVDGNGAASDRRKPNRRLDGPSSDSVALNDGRYALLFHRCRNLRIEGISVRGASFWSCFLRDCEDVVVRKVDVFAHANYNNDGLDISSRNVLVEDCTIDAEDDPLVFKSFEPGIAVSNVVVRNCRLSSNSALIKFGTETFGRFGDIRVEDCTCDCRTPSSTIAPHDFPGETKGVRTHSISGIEVSIVDGGSLENVTIRNIVLGRGIGTPLFVRLGRRHGSALDGGSFLRDVLIENVRMTEPAANAIACSISGVPGLRPSGIVLRNIDFVFPGADAAALGNLMPEGDYEAAFPWPMTFRCALPAYGLYVRNADDVRLEDAVFRLCEGRSDIRPDVVRAP